MENEKIDYLISKVEREPENAQNKAELVSNLIREGTIERAREWIQKSLDSFKPHWSDIKEFHFPIIEQFLKIGEPSEAQPIVLHMNKYFPEESRVKRITTKAKKALTEKTSASVFPSNIPVRNWWDGPHLMSEEHLSEWIPGQITEIEQGEVTIKVAALNENNQLEEDEWKMGYKELREFSVDSLSEKNLISARLEIGIYFDNSVKIKFHEGSS